MPRAKFLGWRSKARRTNTNGRVRLLANSLAALALLATAGAAGGQIVRPQISGPAKNAYDQLHPPSALDQVRQQATQPSPPLPLPPQPGERWVPDRRVYQPELGREIVVPGHYERRVSDQQYTVPSLPAYDPSTGATITIPGGERPPADLRQGP